VLRFARRALELRVLDTQECVRMDVAIAVFARAALASLTRDVLAGRIELPQHDTLVADFEACVRDGSAASVRAPHIMGTCDDACAGVDTFDAELRAVYGELADCLVRNEPWAGRHA
jgi:hypothetical protein